MDIITATDLSGLEVWQLWTVVAVGALLILLGYRVKKVAFFLLWFLLGWTLVSYLMPTINGAFTEIAKSDLWQWLMPLCGGLLLALLGFSIEKVCLAGICFGLSLAIAVNYFGADMQILAIGAVVGVLVAGLAVALMKPATIIATSAGGAYLITVALLQLFPQIGIETWYWPLIAGVTAVGSLIQFMTTR